MVLGQIFKVLLKDQIHSLSLFLLPYVYGDFLQGTTLKSTPNVMDAIIKYFPQALLGTTTNTSALRSNLMMTD